MKRRRDYSQLLIWAALAVTIPRYIGAFVASDMGHVTGWVSGALSLLMGISGFGMGVLDILGMAYVFDGWRSKIPDAGKHPSTRFKILTGFVLGLAVCGVGILAPFTFARVSSAGIADVLPAPALWVWTVLVNAAPLLLIGGVIVGQTGVVTVTHEKTTGTKDGTNETSRDNSGTEHGTGGTKDGTGREEVATAGTDDGTDDTQRYQRYKTFQSGIPLLPASKIMEQFGVPKRTAYRWREKWQNNGGGVEHPS